MMMNKPVIVFGKMSNEEFQQWAEHPLFDTMLDYEIASSIWCHIPFINDGWAAKRIVKKVIRKLKRYIEFKSEQSKLKELL